MRLSALLSMSFITTASYRLFYEEFYPCLNLQVKNPDKG